MNDLTSSTIIVGQFGRPHGIRGWINVNSYTSDPTALFQFESLSSNSNFFDIFSGLESIKGLWVSETSQGAAQLTDSNRRLYPK